MSSADRHAFRRKLTELEAPLFATGAAAPSALEVTQALALLAAAAGPEAASRAERLARLYAYGSASERADYQAEFGACGVRRFSAADGRVIYMMPIETFPNHVNNVYLVRQGAHHTTLVDAGTLTHNASEDFRRAAAVLARSFGEPADVLDKIPDCVITHGHIDHFGGVGRWRDLGARIHVHEFDARIISNMEERMVVTAVAVRSFLARAGVPPELRGELEQMYVSGKRIFKSVPVDRVMVDGSRVGDLVMHHVPGHCPGHVCVQVDNILLTADHVLARITPHQAPESITPDTGLDTYIQSLEKVRRIPGIDLALGAHEEPIPHLNKRIVEIEAFHRERLAKVHAACADQPRSLVEISKLVFGPRVSYDRLLALEETGAHVEYLSRRGQLEIANLDDLLAQSDPVIMYRASTTIPLPDSLANRAA